MVPSHGALQHPPVLAQPGTVWLAAASDARSNAFGPHLLAVLVVVVGAVTVQFVGPRTWPTTTAVNRRYRVGHGRPSAPVRPGRQAGTTREVVPGRRPVLGSTEPTATPVGTCSRTCPPRSYPPAAGRHRRTPGERSGDLSRRSP